MEPNSLNLFQPKPAIDSNKEAEKNYKLIKGPNVGVINPPTISKTPLGDTLCLKKQENPRMAYKVTQNKAKPDFLNTASFLLITACSIAAIFNFKK